MRRRVSIRRLLLLGVGVLIHGLPGTAEDWEDVTPLLAGHRTIAIDRPGFGYSSGGYVPFNRQLEVIHEDWGFHGHTGARGAVPADSSHQTDRQRNVRSAADDGVGEDG
jgi:pimeloyl-ACP methyl ester carboxylesterase